jgi:hypothetical protein
MPTDEQLKDHILQQVNDVLEANDWGGSTDFLAVELVFKKVKYDCEIHVKRKEPKKTFRYCAN